MEMLRVQWTVCVVLLAELLAVTIACPSDTCAVISSNERSIATQVIEILENKSSNDSFTFYIQPGTYNATDGTQTNFYNFINITLQKYPEPPGNSEVVIQCPFFSGEFYNGLGFINSSNISIIEITFVKCGQKPYGCYFANISNVHIINSTFRLNRNNGVGISSGRGINIINCTFEGNIGLQNDSKSYLVQNMSNVFGGPSLGISVLNTTDTTVVVKDCTFRGNVALKTISQSEDDNRIYNNIPFGNGGGICIRLNNVTGITVTVKNCIFDGNIALHQGGAIAAFMIASRDNRVEIIDCHFIGNKAIGYPLYSQIDNEITDYDNFTAEIKKNFTKKNFVASIKEALSRITNERIQETGGYGGAVIINILRECEYNRILINSTFKQNLAIGSAAIGIFMWEALPNTGTNTENGINSNRVRILGSLFYDNHAFLGGSAFGLISSARVDVGNTPVIIKDCEFSENVNEGDLESNLFRFGRNGVITTIRWPLTFFGDTQFDSNIGGCINVNNAKVDVNGTVSFTNNGGTYLGGAVRIVGFSLLQLFPSTNLIFTGNRAQRLGGAIGVDNVRVEEDLALIFNYNCFLQYNAGGDDELYPSNWKANVSFDNNTAVAGYNMYAEDISRCTFTPGHPNDDNSTTTIYEDSLFNLLNVFEGSSSNTTSNFVTAPSVLMVDNDKENETVIAYPGEQFVLSLQVLDQNNNEKVGFYTYHSNAFFTEADVTEIDLTPENKDTSFAVVSGSSDQRTSVVIRNSNFSFEFMNHNKTITKKDFTLSLIDSSTGNMINEVNITAELRSCHFLYNYNSSRGKCQFIRNHTRHILRGDNISTYFYIQPELYGELEDDSLRTARIPSFYQLCGREGGLAGCLVKYDDPYEQCSEGRSGYLCGKCPSGSENEVMGLAFNLLECVSCETSDRILFALICILLVVISIIIMYYNIGLPNSLRGFLFYSQMVGYVYESAGTRRGTLDWDFFLSRVFGFSFYFPICLTRMETLEVVLFGFLPPLLILMSVVTYTMMAKRITPLGKKKTLDGIWFLILIAYVYTFDTCFNLLRCTPASMHTNNFTDIEVHSLVYFYDGSVTCFKDEHIIYAVISILILLTFVIPFPFLVVAISRNYFKRTGPFGDVINTGIKPKFNWWSGYDLLRRLIFVALYFVIDVTNKGDYTKLALATCAIFILLTSSRIHPYNKWRVNLIECLMLLDLVLIAAYFVNTDRLVTGSGFATFLFILPYIYMLIYVVIKGIRKMKLSRICGRLGRIPYSSEFRQNALLMLLHENEPDTPEVIDTSCTEIRETLVYHDYN